MCEKTAARWAARVQASHRMSGRKSGKHDKVTTFFSVPEAHLDRSRVTPAAAAVKTTCTVTVPALHSVFHPHSAFPSFVFQFKTQPANDVDRATRLFFYRSHTGSREHLRDLVSAESLPQTAGV